MIALFTAFDRRIAQVNSAFSLVFRLLGSNWIAEGGTPFRNKNVSMSPLCPSPLTMMDLAAPALNNSSARPARSSDSPPKTTMTSALAGPRSTVSSGLPRANAAMKRRSVAANPRSSRRRDIRVFAAITKWAALPFSFAFRASSARSCIRKFAAFGNTSSRVCHRGIPSARNTCK